MRVILLGAPGSGKGTQGGLIEKAYAFPKVSSGDILRRAVRDGTPWGKEAEKQMRQGRLVSDSVVLEIIRERIMMPDCRKGYVLDGYPRNLAQARNLAEIDPQRPETVIEIEVSPDVLIKRLGARRICSRCERIYSLDILKPDRDGICDDCSGPLILRPDDRPDVIRERLKVYEEQTLPLRAYYRKKRAFHRLDGERSVEDIFADIHRIVDSELAKAAEIEAR